MLCAVVNYFLFFSLGLKIKRLKLSLKPEDIVKLLATAIVQKSCFFRKKKHFDLLLSSRISTHNGMAVHFAPNRRNTEPEESSLSFSGSQ